jgi:hypothetical protein
MRKIPKPNKSERIFLFINRTELFDEVIEATSKSPRNFFFYVMAYAQYDKTLSHTIYYIFKLSRPSKYSEDLAELTSVLVPLGGVLLDEKDRDLANVRKIASSLDSKI